MVQSAKRQAILDTAENLFYAHGFHAVGLKKILEEADTATMTMYHHFASKEQLIEEVLKKREAAYWSYLNARMKTQSESPLVQVVKAHVRWLGDKGKHGCMFLRAMEEFAGTDNQIERIAREHKKRLLDYLRNLARESGYGNSYDIACQMIVLLEGATSITEMIGPEQAGNQALQMVTALLAVWD
ncbi:TetR/AcrR family transcriptional regulator [Alicyclobacillus sp. SO9]|uniref:TetR/AcrR family transcriptional regulator n=1 Tax=Alicyclobacillus sp. SO9 TaxID=2665646 RepID=UPI0018E89B5B|nr:TetR/AcrR family transcriptional regulator [Alicyclobacillus sp. SO9]QQE79141.1 TetR/AcrR family transcriptional regulator [Alicyclobacillus sp. SO9]